MTMEFRRRHIGPSPEDQVAMLSELGLESLDELVKATVPASILSSRPLDLPKALSEEEFLSQAKEVAKTNQVFKSYIGQGYYDCQTPNVILRNILENPGWYTAYTPYQAEISQGRMEALLNFQTMISDLTGLPIANASLLDEGTAVAEGMTLALSTLKQKNSKTILVDQNIFSQSLEVLQTRADAIGVQVRVGAVKDLLNSGDGFALVIQYPAANGALENIEPLIAQAKSKGLVSIVASDLLALCLVKSPGEMGADIVVGSAQRFGVPMGFGGPHAAFLSTREEFKRQIPGRIIGVSRDVDGKPALRLALQTREQHIRREKATSNICTAQVLLAVMASMYAVYHGPKGLKSIAQQVNQKAQKFATQLKAWGYRTVSSTFFDTIQIQLSPAEADQIQKKAVSLGINLGRSNADLLQIAFDEAKSDADLQELQEVFAKGKTSSEETSSTSSIPKELERRTPYLTEKVFHLYHSETEMLRYMHRLETKDLALNQAMIPLGSCTMKLNATAEMIPVTWPEFARLHPFAPLDQAKGYLTMIRELERWLCEITGFAAFSLQPNAGSQGEYAGLLVIKNYFLSKGEDHRQICLIPSSAHGTNPASAVMAGMKVVVVACDDHGNIDVTDLKTKVQSHAHELAALMVTYPSTHGVFEESIKEICDIVHRVGGQVYMDGANMNAQVGLCRPGEFGADVSHLNLHKTFCIPHGGGGPGVGPIGVAKHLAPFLPSHQLAPECGPQNGSTAVSAAPWGSASILPISWAYIAMMGQSLKEATQVAILNANYIAKKLAKHYPTLYSNKKGFVAHECILDLRNLKDLAGVTVDDVAKRLMDYGFHAPTMSWPVAGTLMVEPTESESKAEMDRFIDAMIQIRKEISDIEKGAQPREDNLLRNAPHTLDRLLKSDWSHPYSREEAAFPLPILRGRKFWPAVARVDNAFGDKNLVCTCAPLEAYQESGVQPMA